MNKTYFWAAVVMAFSMPTVADEYLGNYSANPTSPNSTSNPYGAGSPYNPKSINNSYGAYGSPYSSRSANNPYATDAPKLQDSQGNYRGRLSSNFLAHRGGAHVVHRDLGQHPFESTAHARPRGAGCLIFVDHQHAV